MHRIFSLLGVSLTTVVLVTMLSVGVASASSSHSANNPAEKQIFSATLVPDLVPSKEPTIAGIVPGNFPWVLESGHVKLSGDGQL